MRRRRRLLELEGQVEFWPGFDHKKLRAKTKSLSVFVDTTVWSVALRRPAHRLGKEHRFLVDEWRRLVDEGESAIIGPIRQEILSGVRHEADFARPRERLAGVDCIDIRLDDYDQAAQFYNELRGHGLARSSINLLICAVAHRFSVPIFTTDRDFTRYARHLPISLHRPLKSEL
jgi:predicted nucleic acid-binding protein